MSEYNLEEARFDEQRKRMKSLTNRGICFLCDSNVEAETNTPILLKTKHWYVKHNDYPYEGTKQHYMLVPYEHVMEFSDLSPEASAELGTVVNKTIDIANKPEAYSVFMRNGTMALTGASVAHLHMQFMVPDSDYKGASSTKVKLLSFPGYKN
jgi:diadenosine tetraphosphate (Ap4A) HIT family hydrolase